MKKMFILILTYCTPLLIAAGPPPAHADPCDSSKAAAEKLTSLANANVFQTAKQLLATAGKDGKEHSVVFGKDSAGKLTLSPLKSTGIRNSSTIDTKFPGAFADLHNHPGNTVPSAGDIYSLIAANRQYKNIDTRITLLANGSVYAIAVIDASSAAGFIRDHPPETTQGFSPRFPGQLFLEFTDLKSYLINVSGVDKVMADEMATAFILDKYQSGVCLLKVESEGHFRRVWVVVTGSAGELSYQRRICNP
jgi:hypothetical protein